jgi:type IV pilus assembly protein PilA
MVLCGIGLAYYAKSQGLHVAWCVGALLPFFGPILAVKGIINEGPDAKPVKRKWGRVASLVLVAIIGILAAIAIPNFMNYGSKARQSEAKVGLGGIFAAAIVLKEKTQTFVISDISQLGWTPAGTPKYSFWYSVNGVPTRIPLQTGSRYPSGPCEDTPPTTVNVAASVTGFTAAAKGNIDADPTCDEWSINDARVLTNTLNDLQ